jgi:hypothetical protein
MLNTQFPRLSLMLPYVSHDNGYEGDDKGWGRAKRPVINVSDGSEAPYEGGGLKERIDITRCRSTASMSGALNAAKIGPTSYCSSEACGLKRQAPVRAGAFFIARLERLHHA